MRNFLSPLFSSFSDILGRLRTNKAGAESRNYSTLVEAVAADVRNNDHTPVAVPANSVSTNKVAADVASASHMPIVRRRELRVTTTDPLAVAHVAPEKGDNKASQRFRRTKEEIRLGLTREQAMAKRGVNAKASVTITEPKAAPAVIMPDGKRFRRTAKEIELGLTKEAAILLRQRYRSDPPKLNLDKTVVEQLEATLSPRIQARARAVHRYRAAGGKAVLTPETLNEIERFIASGKVTKCPPGMDSDGYDHFNQVDTAAKKDAA